MAVSKSKKRNLAVGSLSAVIIGLIFAYYLSNFGLRGKFQRLQGQIENVVKSSTGEEGDSALAGTQLEQLALSEDFSKVFLVRSENVFEFYLKDSPYVFVKSPAEESLAFSLVLQNEGLIVSQLEDDWWLLKE